MRPPTGFSLIEATRADRSPKKSLVAKAVPVVFSGPTTPIPSKGGGMIEGEDHMKRSPRITARASFETWQQNKQWMRNKCVTGDCPLSHIGYRPEAAWPACRSFDASTLPSYDSIVLVMMTVVVSPRWMVCAVVVTVRVTLHDERANPISTRIAIPISTETAPSKNLRSSFMSANR